MRTRGLTSVSLTFIQPVYATQSQLILLRYSFGLFNYDSYMLFRAIGLILGILNADCCAGVFVHGVTQPCPCLLGDQSSRHENHLSIDCPGVGAACMRLTNTLEEKKKRRPWCNFMGQDIGTLPCSRWAGWDEDQPRTRGTRGVRWGLIATHRWCSMEGCCATSPSALSDGEGVAARREGDISVEDRKYSSNWSPAVEP